MYSFKLYFRKKKKSKSKNKDSVPTLKDEIEAVTEVASGSASTGSKNEVDAEKYYQNKTKSEIAFLKRKEELVSFRCHLHEAVLRWMSHKSGALLLSLYLFLGC